MMNALSTLRGLLLCSLCLTLGPVAVAGDERQAASRPKLVVLFMIDQLRADYLSRFDGLLGPDGFHRLERDGAWFTNANYSYVPTATAAGHASVATGRLPRQHGIAMNQWFQKPGAEQSQGAAWDDSVRLIGLPDAKKAGASPHNQIGPALGDELKLADRRSRVYSVAIKDRAAIYMAGKRPDGVYWWNLDTGRFISSTYYTDALPAVVQAFDDEKWADHFRGAKWERLLPDEAYAGCYPYLPEWTTEHAATAKLPITLPTEDQPTRKYYAAVEASPFGNELVFELASRLLEAEKLGRGPAADMLCVSLSSFDIAGHFYGPQSEHMLDFFVRTDRQLAEFLRRLDQCVGPGNWLLALTGDHGVTPIPQIAQQLNLGGGQIELAKLRTDLNAELNRKFGAALGSKELARPITVPWIDFRDEFGRLEPDLRSEVLDAAVEFLQRQPGIGPVITADELRESAPEGSDDVEKRLVWRGFFDGRSGQIFFQVKPYWYEKSEDLAGHSFGFSYDRHVPILLCGPGLQPGRYAAAADPLDIAPTLANLLGIEPPLDYAGRVLSEALRTR